MGFYSKDDLTQKISTSIFVTNFLDHCTARDLWNVYLDYGKVVDVYIPFKKSKAGKKFAFVRFLKVDNLKRLIVNLCTLWIADSKLDIVLDDSCILKKDLSCAAIGKIKDINALSNLYVILNNKGFDNVKLKCLGGFWVMIETDSISAMEKLIKHVEGLPIYAWNKNALAKTVYAWGTISDVDATKDASLPFKKVCVATKTSTIINDSVKIIVKRKIYWIRIRELEVWSPEFDDEACISSSSDEESVDEENHDSMDETSVDGEKDLEPYLDSESRCMKENNGPRPIINDHTQGIQSNDPFKIYDLLNKKEIKESTKGDDPSYPPGFTPIDASDKVEGDVANSVNQLDTKVQSCSNGMSSVKINVNRSFNLNSGGSIIDVIESLVDIGQTMGPIILREVVVDYGPSPFCVYHSLFAKYGFVKLVEDSWKNFNSTDSCKITLLRRKFHSLKVSIKEWCKKDNQRTNERRFSIQSRLSDIDKMFDNRINNEDLLKEWTSLRKDLHDINMRHSLDLAQKAKIRWSIEGDENSKFSHGIINKKRSHLAIRGVLVEGGWIDDPVKVKNEFLNHYSNRFSMTSGPSINLDPSMFKQLSLEQNIDLKCDVTVDEIKIAVWDCGTNKSPGPDGFSFEFIRIYWKIMNQDVINVVREFLTTSKFPPGSNSLFITLIPKKQDANLVKDLCPISLIGSFYKIIAKILANHLSMVISDLVSDVQSAFVSNRQILDGPFILNELLSWCKNYKTKAMLFKVDFEKAFDSVRWDYLDGILSNFGFGTKWRRWIQGFLTSAMGSIPINGSPTSEFKFHKGLKQGDPLSLFLFILVMESLHLSFNNILNTGLFKGLRINDTLTLSHLFYVDDTVFIVLLLGTISSERFSLSSQGINFNLLLKKKVGNEVNTLFWDDTWLNDTSLRQLFPRYPRGGIKEDQFHSLVDLTASVILSNSVDRWVWLLDSSGEYSVSLARTYIDDSLLPTIGSPTRWVKVVSIKINIFAWKVSLDKLPSRFNLSLRGIDTPSIMCPICNLAGESSSHLLFSCSMARFLWRKVTR
nr:RNA-directed DNA polymerase, eukaryota [Tanacetum cinerariifolium]